MPSNTAFAIAGGFVAAGACLCCAAAMGGDITLVALCAPFFIGAVAGLFAMRRPVHGAMTAFFLALLVAAAVAWALLGEGALWYLGALPILALFGAAAAVLGAICTAIVRRWFLGHAARRHLERTWTLAAGDVGRRGRATR